MLENPSLCTKLLLEFSVVQDGITPSSNPTYSSGDLAFPSEIECLATPTKERTVTKPNEGAFLISFASFDAPSTGITGIGKIFDENTFCGEDFLSAQTECVSAHETTGSNLRVIQSCRTPSKKILGSLILTGESRIQRKTTTPSFAGHFKCSIDGKEKVKLFLSECVAK
jgi:hypothetical protein